MTVGKIEIVPRGWDHATWVGTYYPPDLPTQWRLTYFANEFTGVVVPADVWPAMDPAVMASWAEDVVHRFHFFLELPQVGEPPDLRQTRDLLGDCLGGLVLPPGRPLPVGGGVPLYQKVQMQRRSVFPVDREQAPPLATEIQGLPGADLRAARNWLEDLVRFSPTSSSILVIVGGERPDLATLRDLTDLVSLSGLG